MSIPLNTNFSIHIPKPIDGRTQVNTYSELSLIPVKFIGLKTYVVDEDVSYRYYSSGWQLVVTGGGSAAVWGSITGTLSAQTDLNNKLNEKFDKIGGTISGAVTVLANTEGYNFILAGSAASSGNGAFVKLVTVPATATSTGVVGEVAFDANFAYFCVATNVWVRAAVNTWV